MIIKVISGGQTGGDQASWRAAKRLDVVTGGTMPRGFKTEAGPRPEFAKLYGAVEHDSPDYQPRTKQNVIDSDITIYVRRNSKDSPWFWKTGTYARGEPKPFWDVRELRFGMDPLTVARFFRLFNYQIVNFVGTCESSDNGIGRWAEEFIYTFIKEVNGASK